MIFLNTRLNYKYSFKDAYFSLLSLFKSPINYQPLYSLFNNDKIVFTNHARTCLRVALNSLRLGNGSKIGIVAFNCSTVFDAIQRAGYLPVFIDITDSFQIDINDLKKKKNYIDALIITHLFGFPADMDKIKEIVPGIPIIEDCAHAFLSQYKNRFVGTLSDIGIFSIGKAKFPSIGKGGFMVVNNERYLNYINNEIKTLKTPNILLEINSIISSLILNLLHHPIIYNFFTNPILKKIDKIFDLSGKLDFNEYKALTTSKALFIHKLNMYHKDKITHTENAYKILNHYKDIYSINTIVENNDYNPNFFMCPLLIPEGKNNLIKQYYKSGVEIGSHFGQAIEWAQTYSYYHGTCINCEKIASNIVVFPTFIHVKLLK